MYSVNITVWSAKLDSVIEDEPLRILLTLRLIDWLNEWFTEFLLGIRILATIAKVSKNRHVPYTLGAYCEVRETDINQIYHKFQL